MIDQVLICLIGSIFIVYHIFGQPRILTKGDKIQARIIYHFGGFLLAASLVLFFIYYFLGFYYLSQFWYHWVIYQIFITGAVLIVYDLIVLIKRWANYTPDIPSVEPSQNTDKELEELKEQFEKLQADANKLLTENNSIKETLVLYKSKQFEYESKFNDMRIKEDDFARLKREWESQKHTEHLAFLEVQKQKETEVEKRFADKLHSEKEQLQERFHQKMTEFMDSVTDKLERRILSEKKNLVDDVFKFDGSSRDDIFELKRTKENMDKERENLEKNKFKLELDDLVSKSKEHVLEAKTSALDVKSENVDIRSDIKLMAGEFKNELLIEKTSREKSLDTVLHKLELEEERRKSEIRDIDNKIALLGEQTKGQITELASIVSNNLKDLEMRTMSSFREVRENMSEMKLQFGQEVMRLDSQQGQIINELEKYYIKSQEFVNKCQGIALEARKQNLEGQNILNQVDHLYKQHRVDAKSMENRLQTSMDQVAVKEGHLANTIGDSMLKLKAVTDEQYIASKDLALEKKGAEVLWKEKNLQHDMNLQEVRHQKQDLDRTKQFFDQEKSNFINRKNDMLQNAQLQQKINMDERRFYDTLRKAESSDSFLTKVAKIADHAFSRQK